MEPKKSKLTSEAKLLLVMGVFVLIGGAFLAVSSGDIKIPGGTPPASPTPPPPPPLPKVTRAVFDSLVKNARHIGGDTKADVTMVEFADFQCPACRKAYEAAVSKIEKKDLPIRYIFYNFPLSQIHPRAIPAALAAEAAGKQGKFWPMYEALFDGLKSPLDPGAIDSKAESVGVNLDKLHKDVQDPALMQAIDADRDAGMRAGVNETPTFLIYKQGDSGDPTVAVGGDGLKKALLKLFGSRAADLFPPA